MKHVVAFALIALAAWAMYLDHCIIAIICIVLAFDLES